LNVLVTKKRWLPKEIRILKIGWLSYSEKKLCELLVNRTWRSIQTMALRLGLRGRTDLIKQNPDGTFKRKRKRFSLENFDDGFVDNRGRFRVWLPEHPRAYESGYVLRAIVAYEAYYNTKVPSHMDIHHEDGNRLNDSKENLVMMPHSVHSILHNSHRVKLVPRICEHCGREFTIKRHRLNQKDHNRGRFCSQKCFQMHPRSTEHKAHIADGNKKAWLDPEVRARRLEGLKRSWRQRKEKTLNV
jgi:hypothetical protein